MRVHNFTLHYQRHRLCQDLPPGYPDQTPPSSKAFATSNTPEDMCVEGYTFHAYSIPSMMANLLRSVRHKDERIQPILLDREGIPRSPSQEWDLLRIPGVKLVMKGSSK